MAVKKKAKKKGKSKSSVKKKKTTAKKLKKHVAKKPSRPKRVKKKPAKKKSVTKVASKPTSKAAAPKTQPTPTESTVPAGEVRVGTVTHYYSHLMVAVVKVETGMLREGDNIHIKGHTTDFRQRAGSLELDHVQVPAARPGESVGLKVVDHAREHDVVYIVSAPK